MIYSHIFSLADDRGAVSQSEPMLQNTCELTRKFISFLSNRRNYLRCFKTSGKTHIFIAYRKSKNYAYGNWNT